MKLIQRIRDTLLMVLLAGVSAVAAANPVAGKDYKVLAQPVAVETGAKIEVLEIFWYGCPHCFDLEPGIVGWKRNLAGDVQFRRMPGIFRESWVVGAKAYYALEAMGQIEAVHADLFNEIHLRNLKAEDDKGIADFMERQGLNRRAFEGAYNGFSMPARINRTKQLTRAYGIDGVPALVVDGKYVTSVPMTGSQANLFATLDHLIKLARQDRAKK